MALLVLDEDVAPRVERAPGPGALRLEGRVRRLRRALEVPKGRAAVRRERLEVENLMIFCCERPQHARLADARAAADDDHARALLEQFSQVPPVGAVAAVEHEDVDVPARQQPRHRPAPQAAAPAVDAHDLRLARDALRERAEAALFAQLREAEPHRLVAALLGVALAHVGALRVVEERRRVGPRDGVPRELRRRPHVDAARAAVNTTPQELGRAHDARRLRLRHGCRERGERLRPGREGAAVQRALDVVGGQVGCIFRGVRSFLQRRHCVLRAMRCGDGFFGCACSWCYCSAQL